MDQMSIELISKSHQMDLRDLELWELKYRNCEYANIPATQNVNVLTSWNCHYIINFNYSISILKRRIWFGLHEVAEILSTVIFGVAFRIFSPHSESLPKVWSSLAVKIILIWLKFHLYSFICWQHNKKIQLQG